MTLSTNPTAPWLSRDLATLDLLLDEPDPRLATATDDLAPGEDPHERAHEMHGGDESPSPEDCALCFRFINSFLTYGVGY